MAEHLSATQKQSLYDDGYVVVKHAVDERLVDAALNCINQAEQPQVVGTNQAMTDLVNASSVAPILQEAMGYFDPPKVCQMGILPVRKPSNRFNNLGYRDRDMPYFGSESHVDGSMTIAVPQEVQQGTEQEIYRRYIASGPNGDLGRSPDVIGHNMVPMFQDPDMTLGLGSFTAFVFVCLNDQTQEGCGQTSLLKGSHHEVERFFRWQRDTNNHLGVEGPGWPRLNFKAPNRCGLVYLPEAVRSKFIDSDAESTPDGKFWPRPTQILMEPGDVCIAMYHIPHSGTRNELGKESRKTVIFRLRNKARQPDKMVNGVTDHPDRGQRGQWLAFESGNNPWERSKYAMCNMWHEWHGMRETVRRNLAIKQTVSRMNEHHRDTIGA